MKPANPFLQRSYICAKTLTFVPKHLQKPTFFNFDLHFVYSKLAIDCTQTA